MLEAIPGKLQKIKWHDGTEVEFPVGTEFELIIDARSLPITLVETAQARKARLEREENRINACSARLIEQEAEK